MEFKLWTSKNFHFLLLPFFTVPNLENLACPTDLRGNCSMENRWKRYGLIIEQMMTIVVHRAFMLRHFRNLKAADGRFDESRDLSPLWFCLFSQRAVLVSFSRPNLSCISACSYGEGLSNAYAFWRHSMSPQYASSCSYAHSKWKDQHAIRIS